MATNSKLFYKMREILLTFFYSGKAKKAPGTCGSIATVLLWIILTYLFFKTETSLHAQNIFWAIFTISAFLYGTFNSKIYASAFGEIDHPSIVLDEVVGQIIALQIGFVFYYQNYFNLDFASIHIVIAFILFRFFDIKKPLFIGYFDRTLKSGFGVMFDDLLSGLIAGFATIFILKLF